MSKEAMKLALEALEGADMIDCDMQEAIIALRQALANEALDKMAENARELGLDYEPAQRPWQGLTDEEVLSEAKRFALGLSFPFNGITTPEMFARAIEAKLKEKNV